MKVLLATALGVLVILPCTVVIASDQDDSSSVRVSQVALSSATDDRLVGSSVHPQATTTLRVPARFDPHCAEDVTGQLNQWLRAVPDGSIVEFPRDACYQMNRALQIEGRHRLTIEGNGATLKRVQATPAELIPGNPANRNRQHNWHVHIAASDHITIENLRVQGLNATSDIDADSVRGRQTFESRKFGASFGDKYGEAGFVIIDSDDVKLDGVQTDATFGDGIMFGSDNQPVSHRIVVQNATVDRNGRQGMSFTSVDGALVSNVRILHSHATGFDFEPNGAKSFVRNVEIRNAFVNSYTVAFSLGGQNNVSQINIHDNIVRYSLSSYPWLSGVGTTSLGGERSAWAIARNVVQSPTLGIQIENVKDLSITGNRQLQASHLWPAANAGIRLKNVEGAITIRRNDLNHASEVFEAIGDTQADTIHACDNRIGTVFRFDKPVRCRD